MKSVSIGSRASKSPVACWLAVGMFAGCLAVFAQVTPSAPDNSSALSAAAVPSVSTNADNTADGDKAWRAVYLAIQDPMPPKEWQDKAPTDEEQKAFYVPKLIKGADLARDFYTRFPDHRKAEAARKAEYRLITIAVHEFSDQSQSARLGQLMTERLKDPKLGEDERVMLMKDPSLPDSERVALLKADTTLSDDDRFALRANAVAALLKTLPSGLDAFMTNVEALRADYPQRPEPYVLLMDALQIGAGNRTAEITKEIMDGPAPQQIKDILGGRIRQQDAIGKPLDVKFVAFDGTEVDVSQMKGKVVMIDYWATWCGPCLGELPNVKAAYEKYHDKGFDIVGISFDTDKDSLTKFLAKEKTPWPEYFDGKKWGNKFGMQFGINSIPTMWLVDKKGNLRYVDARDKLDDYIPQLLKE